MKNKIAIFICIFALIFSSAVFAEALKVTLNGEQIPDSELFRYEFPDGIGFSTNISQSENNEEFAIFNFDEGIKWQFIFAGSEIEYNIGEMLIESGEYTLIVYKDNLFANFNFLIKNMLFEDGGDEITEEEGLNAFLEQLKKENPEAFEDISNLTDSSISLEDEKEMSEYIDSKEFMDKIYESLMGSSEGYDDSELAQLIIGSKIDNVELELRYDEKLGMYVYTMPNRAEIYTSIPNRGITQYGVQVFFREDATAEIYNIETKEKSDYISGDIVSKEGTYEIIVEQLPIFGENISDAVISQYDDDYELLSESKIDQNTYIAHYYFTIQRQATSRLEIINSPDDFIISAVSLNGESQKKQSNYSYIMKNDGKYEFTFSSKFTNKLTYTFSVERDTHKPKLNISQEALSGKSTKPVTWVAENPEDTIKVTYNSRYINDVSTLNNQVSEYGSYTIEVTDKAGNSQIYTFDIELAYRSNFMVMVILLLALVAVIICYLIYSKRSLKVL